MQNEAQSTFRTILTEFVKSHDECVGKVMEFADHLDQAVNTARSLPIDVQYQLKNFLMGVLAARGLGPMFFGK